MPWAHPRSRGDHVSPKAPALSASGSSPLARGPLGGKPKIQVEEGLIPARAGTTCQDARRCRPCWAHPRSRGDHTTSPGARVRNVGSSPLARGPPIQRGYAAHHVGLIPARAGTTRRSLSFACSSRAHPRSRGDHLSRLFLRTVHLGSSPLARGPRSSEQSCRRPSGLIPARAGTTSA